MTTHIKSINRRVWKVVEIKIEIADLENPTTAEEVLLQNNDIALSAIHDAIDETTTTITTKPLSLKQVGVG